MNTFFHPHFFQMKFFCFLKFGVADWSKTKAGAGVAFVMKVSLPSDLTKSEKNKMINKNKQSMLNVNS